MLTFTAVFLLQVLVFSNVLAQDSAASARPESTVDASQATQKTITDLLDGATAVGDGIVQIYQTQGKTLITLKPQAFDRLFHWYVEAVVQPPQIVSLNGNAVGETVMRLERRGQKVYLRDLASGLSKRAASRPDLAPQRSAGASEQKLRPIDLSLAEAGLGAVVLGLDILAEDEDGTVLLDLTAAFSADIGGALSVKNYLEKAGLVFVAVDPKRSYIESAIAFGNNVTIRSHLTFANATGESASIRRPNPAMA